MLEFLDADGDNKINYAEFQQVSTHRPHYLFVQLPNTHEPGHAVLGPEGSPPPFFLSFARHATFLRPSRSLSARSILPPSPFHPPSRASQAIVLVPSAASELQHWLASLDLPGVAARCLPTAGPEDALRTLRSVGD